MVRPDKLLLVNDKQGEETSFDAFSGSLTFGAVAPELELPAVLTPLVVALGLPVPVPDEQPASNAAAAPAKTTV
jgi:hypothetical protein